MVFTKLANMSGFNKNTYIKALQILLPASLLAVLATFGVAALLRGEKPNFRKFENRSEVAYPEWDNKEWLDGNYQKQLNSALSDHLPYVIPAKTLYFQRRYSRLLDFQKNTYNFSDYYVHFSNDLYLYGDSSCLFLLFKFDGKLSSRIGNIKKTSQIINSDIEHNPQTQFYLYYVQREIDNKFDENIKSSCYDTLRSLVSLPMDHFCRLEISDFDQYRRFFYQADHHWQCFGSYQGYKDVFHLLKLDEQGESLMRPVDPDDSMSFWVDDNSPVETDGTHAVLVATKYHQSKSRMTGTTGLFSGKMYVYRFNYSPMKIYRNGEPFEYGNEDMVLHNQDSTINDWITYSFVYGDDIGELVFETERTDRPNLLIIGDSYDNAILKLLAGHFHKMYSVDLRHFERQTNAPFIMDDYIQKNKIDVVLLFGNIGFYSDTGFFIQ